MKNQFSKLQMEDLNEFQKEIAELIGLENYLKLTSYFGGEAIYIQVPEKMHIKARNRDIIRDFETYSIKELAKKYRLSSRQIYSILYSHGILKKNQGRHGS